MPGVVAVWRQRYETICYLLTHLCILGIFHLYCCIVVLNKLAGYVNVVRRRPTTCDYGVWTKVVTEIKN